MARVRERKQPVDGMRLRCCGGQLGPLVVRGEVAADEREADAGGEEEGEGLQEGEEGGGADLHWKAGWSGGGVWCEEEWIGGD